jgi:hypothetical protein
VRFYFWRTCVWVESVDVSIELLTQTYLIPRHYTKELFYTRKVVVYETISILLLYLLGGQKIIAIITTDLDEIICNDIL